jgi:8-oxo-dGTP pyrophosphatase MutT (NUDIX family)
MSDQPSAPPPKRWKKLGHRTVAHTRIFDVRSVDFLHPARPEPRDFFVISAPDWVNVVALTPDHRLVLVRQFRYGIDDFSLEIPGGIIDAGEDPVAAGVRELREESGYVGTSARLLGSVHPNPAMQDNRCHLVLVEGAQRSAELEWDENEEMEILALPVDEVYRLAQAGSITHSMVLNGLLLFAPVWARLRGGSAV